jgi:hypothetical protein
MRAVVRAGLIGCGLALCGCNVLLQAQAGPVVAVARREARPGVEGSAAMYVDMTAGSTWLDCHLDGGSCEPPEAAVRAGGRNAYYLRGTGLGFAMGLEPGIFVGRTDGQKLFLLSGGGRFGFETLGGTAYGTVGIQGALTAGVAVRKSYSARALILCRSLTYLTASLQGTADYLPAAAAGASPIPAVSLLLGVIGFDDGGAPSDYGMSEGRCPR